jgi:hypothetical protein
MTPPDYKATAAKLTGHEDCPHWMDDDHYCRKCEAIGPVLKALTQADALGYARGREEAFTKAHEIVAGYGAYECAQPIHDELHDAASALTAEPAKEKP